MLWLLRHAEAADGFPDDERPLTERGIEQAEAAGRALGQLGATIDACLCSPKLRAVQTAQLACAPLGVEVTVERRLAGEPFDADDLDAPDWGEVLLVGHDPSFSLTLHDLTGAQARMKKGGFAGIDQGRARRPAAPAELGAIAGAGRESPREPRPPRRPSEGGPGPTDASRAAGRPNRSARAARCTSTASCRGWTSTIGCSSSPRTRRCR